MKSGLLYMQRKAEGICVACGKKKARPNRVKCKACALKDLQRLDQRKCVECGKRKVLPGHNKCSKCYGKPKKILYAAERGVKV